MIFASTPDCPYGFICELQPTSATIRYWQEILPGRKGDIKHRSKVFDGNKGVELPDLLEFIRNVTEFRQYNIGLRSDKITSKEELENLEGILSEAIQQAKTRQIIALANQREAAKIFNETFDKIVGEGKQSDA